MPNINFIQDVCNPRQLQNDLNQVAVSMQKRDEIDHRLGAAALSNLERTTLDNEIQSNLMTLKASFNEMLRIIKVIKNTDSLESYGVIRLARISFASRRSH